jgi:hypothetical protein
LFLPLLSYFAVLFAVVYFCRCPFLPLSVFVVVRFCRHPERSEGSLYFVFAFAVAFLLVIPEGDLLLHL